jgi:two-component system nitrate/nitrite response regulator NarL
MSIRIVIADDHNLVREGLKNFLSFDPELEVVGLAADGREAVELTRQFRPEVVLMDLAMPNLSGLEALRLIRQEVPESIILVLSGGQEVEKIADAISKVVY